MAVKLVVVFTLPLVGMQSIDITHISMTVHLTVCSVCLHMSKNNV